MPCRSSERVFALCLAEIEVRAQWWCRLLCHSAPPAEQTAASRCRARGASMLRRQRTSLLMRSFLYYKEMLPQAQGCWTIKKGQRGYVVEMPLFVKKKKWKINNDDNGNNKSNDASCNYKSGRSLIAQQALIDMHMLLCYSREGIDPQRTFRWFNVRLEILSLWLPWKWHFRMFFLEKLTTVSVDVTTVWKMLRLLVRWLSKQWNSSFLASRWVNNIMQSGTASMPKPSIS